MVEGSFPETSSTLQSQAMGCAMAAGLVELVAVVRRRMSLTPRREVLRFSTGQGGLCLVLVGPVVAQALSGRRIGADPATLALASVPSVIAVVGSAAASTETGDLPGLLWPGLAGLAGLLLVLPQPSFSEWRPWIGIISLPLLVGLGGGLAIRGEDPFSGEDRLNVVGGLLMATVVFGVFWMVSSGASAARLSLGACGLDALSALLLVTTLRQLGARRWSSQFLLIPLLGLLEGLAFLRPVLDWRSWLGLALLGLGGAYQLLFRAERAGGFLTLRDQGDVPGA